jgi:hypothetical protein
MADTELNEWTLICRTIVLLIEEYITLCCPDVLRVHYDKAEEKGRIRPDLQLILKHAQSPKVLLCEVALEELDLSSTDFTQSHKDAIKLPTFMRDQLEKQLQILPPQNAGVFGILMGKFHLHAFFMNAKHKKEDWAFIVQEVDKISLAEPSGLMTPER